MTQLYNNPRYQIDEAGKTIVRNETGHTLTISDQVIKGKITGYKYVTVLCFPYKWKRIAVHRLVAQTFIPNPDNLPEVNHIDHDRGNNHVSNLEWCTHQYNMEHSKENREPRAKGVDHGNFGQKRLQSTKDKQSAAKQGTKHPKFSGYYIVYDRPYTSARQASKVVGLDPRTIIRKCKQGVKGGNYYFEPAII